MTDALYTNLANIQRILNFLLIISQERDLEIQQIFDQRIRWELSAAQILQVSLQDSPFVSAYLEKPELQRQRLDSIEMEYLAVCEWREASLRQVAHERFNAAQQFDQSTSNTIPDTAPLSTTVEDHYQYHLTGVELKYPDMRPLPNPRGPEGTGILVPRRFCPAENQQNPDTTD